MPHPSSRSCPAGRSNLGSDSQSIALSTLWHIIPAGLSHLCPGTRRPLPIDYHDCLRPNLSVLMRQRGVLEKSHITKPHNLGQIASLRLSFVFPKDVARIEGNVDKTHHFQMIRRTGFLFPVVLLLSPQPPSILPEMVETLPYQSAGGPYKEEDAVCRQRGAFQRS